MVYRITPNVFGRMPRLQRPERPSLDLSSGVMKCWHERCFVILYKGLNHSTWPGEIQGYRCAGIGSVLSGWSFFAVAL